MAADPATAPPGNVVSSPVAIGAHPRDEAACRTRAFTTSARDALRALWVLHGDRKRRLLMPSYIGWSPLEGSGCYDPAIETGTPVGFVRVGPRLALDLDDLRRQLDVGDVFAVKVIHYFGFVQPHMDEIADLVASAGAVLIEDCAHAPPVPPFGAWGDYAVFSLHKVFPCESGGMVSAGSRRAALHDLVLPPIAPDDLRRFAASDPGLVARARRENAGWMLERVRGVRGVSPLHPDIPDDATPLNLPVIVDHVDRFELYGQMRARGVQVVALYHTLIPPIVAEEHPTALALSRRVLNLPTHQDLGQSELAAVVDALVDALRALEAR